MKRTAGELAPSLRPMTKLRDSRKSDCQTRATVGSPEAISLPPNIALCGINIVLPQGNMLPVSFSCEPAEAICFEVFCGRGRISVACRDLGMSVIPVDHKPKCPDLQVVLLDLCKADDLQIFLEVVTTANVLSAHFAPVCGTASRAREKPLPPELSHIDSPPLWSDEHPFGLPGLAPHHKARVEAANSLYAVTVSAIWLLVKPGSKVSCENPSNSLFWRIADMLAQDLPDPTTWRRLTNIVFDMCMHGGERKKSTTFKSSPDFLEALQLACNGSHKRASWKPQAMGGSVIFPTAGEAEYPKLLAQRYTQAVHRALLREGVAFEGSHMQAGVAKPRDLRAFTKRAAPPLMLEYWIVCPLCCVPASWPHKILPSHLIFPKNGDVVVQVKGVADVEKLVEDHAGVAKTLVALRGENANGSEAMAGIFRLPLQTVRATAPLSHPLELALPVPDPVIRAILKVLRLGPIALRQLRIQTLESLQSATVADIGG